MKTFYFCLAALLLLGFGLYLPAANHFVRTGRGVIILDKRFLTYADTFADVREWSSADFDAHPELKSAMINQGYRDMLIELEQSEMKASFGEAVDKAHAAAANLAEKVDKTLEIWLGDAAAVGSVTGAPSGTNRSEP